MSYREDQLVSIESSMELVDKETKIVCPYDDVHVVRAKRFQYHLMKCRKNYAGGDMVTCPFNARHIIPRPEQRHHIETCPDKALIEPDAEYNSRRLAERNTYEGNISVPKYLKDRPAIRDSGEDWDDDIENDSRQYSYPPAQVHGMGYHPTQSYARPREPRQPRHQFGGTIQKPPQMAANPPAGPYQPPMNSYQPPLNSYQPVAGPPTNSNQAPVMAPAQPGAAQAPSWANIAGIGRGIPRNPQEFPPVGRGAPGIGRGAAGFGRGVPGVGRGVVKPPPGFGRGQRGPTIAANIYNNGPATDTSSG